MAKATKKTAPIATGTANIGATVTVTKSTKSTKVGSSSGFNTTSSANSTGMRSDADAQRHGKKK